MSDNAQLVRGAYDAFGRGDIPALLAVLSDDVVWDSPEPLPQAMNAHGHAGVMQFFQKVGSSWEDLQVEIDDLVTAGDRVCVLGHAGGKLGGRTTGYDFAHAWTLRNGACVSFHEYVDPEPALVAG
jgi:uncharacterized protein